MIHQTLQKMANTAQRMQRERGLFTHYRRDLFFWDRDILLRGRPDDRYIWLVKECGTSIQRLDSSWSAIGTHYWLDNSKSLACFVVDVEAETIQPISRSAARRLSSNRR